MPKPSFNVDEWVPLSQYGAQQAQQVPSGFNLNEWVPLSQYQGITGEKKSKLLPTTPAEAWTEAQGIAGDFSRGALRLGGMLYDAADFAGKGLAKAVGAKLTPGQIQEAKSFDTGEKLVQGYNSLKPLGIIPIQTSGPATEPQSAMGRIAGTAAEYAPGALLGGSVPQMAAAGLAGGAAREAGAGPIGELISAVTVPTALTGVKVGARALKNVIGRGAAKSADSYALEALGARGVDISKSTQQGMTYVDDMGNMVSLDDAVDVMGVLERNWQRIKAKGFIPTNKAEANLLAVERQAKILTKQADKLISDADAAAVSIAQQTGTRFRFQPDWNEVKSVLAGPQKVGSSQVQRLEADLAKRMQAWKQTDQTLTAMREFKRRIADDLKMWEKSSDSLPTRYGQALYRAFQRGLEKNFDAVMQRTNPQLKGALKEINGDIAAYLSFVRPLQIARSKGVVQGIVSQIMGGSLGGALGRAGLIIGAGLGSGPVMGLAGLGAIAAERTMPGAMYRGLSQVSNLRSAPVSLAATGKKAAQDALVAAITGTANMKQPSTPQVVSAKRIEGPENLDMDRLVQAIIAQESSGNPNAIGPKIPGRKNRAQGLMQLMPAAAKEVGVTDRLNAEENRRGGTAYLQKQIDRFKDPLLAVAAFNAGPNRVQQAIDQAQSRDWELIRALLPEETRKYVPAVMGRYKRG